jgi:NADPH:quinone reductase-like Zn-dependent oxidoreductase
MRAITFSQYGSPSVLKLSQIDKPTPKANEVLVKIKATAVNTGDLRIRAADPFLVRLMYGIFKPKTHVLGSVFAGIVEAVGTEVTRYKVGDEIFGLSNTFTKCYAEYVVVPESGYSALKPSNTSFEEAASIPFGAHTALDFLKKADLKSGQSILIYGASGAVGSAAVMLAKYYKAHVTAVCSTGNLEMVKSLGADEVIDYTKTDLNEIKDRYDVVFESVDKTSIEEIVKLCKPEGILILSAVMPSGILKALRISKKNKIKLLMGQVAVTAEDMEFIKERVEKGDLKPVVDKIYPLEEMVQAHEYADRGHKKGNVAIKI